jgi:hypothetical protein
VSGDTHAPEPPVTRGSGVSGARWQAVPALRTVALSRPGRRTRDGGWPLR